MSEKLIYYAHYGSSHLRRRGCRARKQILSGQETPQLKANVIMGGPGGHFYTSLKVQAVQIVIVADMRRSCQVWQVRGRFSTCFLDYICFSTRTSGHEGAKTLCSELKQTSPMLSSFVHRSSFSIAFKQGCFTPLTCWSWVLLKCYWEMTWLISRITVMVFDLVHHKGNILFIFSVKGFNHPQSMMEVIRIMRFFFVFFKRHTWPREKELQYLQSLTMETFTIGTWCSKAWHCWSILNGRKTVCSVTGVTGYIGKIYG